MTRGRAAIAAVVMAVAMALTGVGISQASQAKATQQVVSDRSLVAQGASDVTLVGDEERTRGSCCVTDEERSHGSCC